MLRCITTFTNIAFRLVHFPFANFLSPEPNGQACSFGSGLRKFALDPVVVIFFKKCQKNYKCWLIQSFFENPLDPTFFRK